MSALAPAQLRWRTALSALLPLLTAGATLAAPLPGGFAYSGWYQFELIVLADMKSETLESETWPMAPTVGYPARWRWLQDPTTMISLTEAHPEAHIVASPSGHLSVHLPLPPAPSWSAPKGLLTEGDLSLIDELVELGEGTDTSAYRLSLETLSPASTDAEVEAGEEDAPGPVLPFEEIAPAAPATPLTALESLGISGPAVEPAAPSVAIPFAAPTVLPELLPVTVAARGIPMPESFTRQPLEQLAAGLSRYRRGSDDELVAAASWLQGPGDDNLAILLEPETDSNYPPVQGFIQLLPRGGTWRLGINFWANTQGHYLPDFFEMPPPPPSPQRIAIIETTATQSAWNAETPTAHSTREGVGYFPAGAPQAGPMATTPRRSRELTADDSTSGSLHGATPLPTMTGAEAIPERPEWPWRHMIHVADTIPMTENRLRYYDHPVIKVIALWRELSWYEVFARGKSALSATEAPDS